MKIFICRICGEVYLGPELPPSCPFCGAEKKFLALGHVWQDANIGVVPTEREKELLSEALGLEVSNAAFYNCVSKTSTDTEIAKMFKSLSKVETEHAEVFMKLLGLDALPEAGEACEDDRAKTLEASLARENRASEFYTKALAESTTPRVREVFEAIRNVENTHIELDRNIAGGK